MTLGERELIYLAGVLDYSGAISLSEKNGPVIRFSSTKHRKIALVAALLRVNITGSKPHEFVLRVAGKPAQEIVVAVFPYLRLNKPLAKSILEWKLAEKRVAKVPCKKGCGRLMTNGSVMCWPCWREYVGSGSRKSQPASAIVVVEPEQKGGNSVESVTKNGRGEITLTKNGHIHRVRG